MPAQQLTWVDGARAPNLPLPDRGLAYGDGLFETLLLLDGEPVLLPLHQARLSRGLEALYLPPMPGLLEEVLQVIAGEATAGVSSLRLTLTRGAGPRGYAPPEPAQPRWIAQLEALAFDPLRWPSPARLGLSPLALASQPALAGIKHLNRLEQVLAARCARESGDDDAILCDQRGAPVCTTAGNLFAVRGSQLLTPPLVDCGVAGTRRRVIIEQWAPALGMTVRETHLSLAQLLEADELFYCNSLRGVRAVASLAARSWSAHPIAGALHEHYCKLLGGAAA